MEYEDLEDLPGIGKRRRISLLVFDNKVHPVQSTYSFSASKMYRFQRYFRLSVAVYGSLITVEFFIIITLTRIVFKKRIAIMILLHFCVIHGQKF